MDEFGSIFDNTIRATDCPVTVHVDKIVDNVMHKGRRHTVALLEDNRALVLNWTNKAILCKKYPLLKSLEAFSGDLHLVTEQVRFMDREVTGIRVGEL